MPDLIPKTPGERGSYGSWPHSNVHIYAYRAFAVVAVCTIVGWGLWPGMSWVTWGFGAALLIYVIFCWGAAVSELAGMHEHFDDVERLADWRGFRSGTADRKRLEAGEP